jgi:hypothetical protein
MNARAMTGAVGRFSWANGRAALCATVADRRRHRRYPDRPRLIVPFPPAAMVDDRADGRAAALGIAAAAGGGRESSGAGSSARNGREGNARRPHAAIARPARGTNPPCRSVPLIREGSPVAPVDHALILVVPVVPRRRPERSPVRAQPGKSTRSYGPAARTPATELFRAMTGATSSTCPTRRRAGDDRSPRGQVQLMLTSSPPVAASALGQACCSGSALRRSSLAPDTPALAEAVSCLEAGTFRHLRAGGPARRRRSVERRGELAFAPR